MTFIDKIITGEKLQCLCDIYIGTREDFNFNPIIKIQYKKHIDINNIDKLFNNPNIIFCYSHNLEELSKKIKFFQNKFILITHNSDHNILNTVISNIILNNKNLIKWFAQNISFKHEKLHLLPIGFANSMWEHGNLTLFNNLQFIKNLNNKDKNIYFNFNINTNLLVRTKCFNSLKNRIEWLPTINPINNLIRLSKYKFCICPEGNGYDTHRLWECLYLKVVPIVINSPFVEILLSYNIPLLVLNNWTDLNISELNYDAYNFDDEIFKNILYFDNIKINIFKLLD